MFYSTALKIQLAAMLFFLCFVTEGPSYALQAQDPSAIPIEAFAKPPSILRLRLSPHGDAIAMKTIMNEQPVMVVQNLDGSDRRLIGPRPKYEIASFYWVNNDDLLILYRFDKSKGTKSMRFAVSKLYSFNRQTEKFIELFKPDARYLSLMWNRTPLGQSNFLSWLPDDPDHILMSARNGNERYPAAFKLNIHSGARKTIQSGKPSIWGWRVDRNDNVRLGYGTDSDSKGQKIIYKNNAGEWVDATSKLDVGWSDNKYRFSGFDSQSDSLIVRALSEYGTKGIYKFDLETQEITETIMEHEKYDAGSVIKDGFTQKIIGHYYYSDSYNPKFTDPIYQAAYTQLQAKLRGLSVNIYSKARSNNRFLVYASSERLPGMYFIYDHDTKQLQPIAPTHPKIDSRIMSNSFSINYEARDGLQIQGYVTVPLGKAAKNLPLIVWPHGGPQSRTTKSYSAFVQFLASRGYVVFQPNFRGSTGFGQAFQLAFRGEWGGKMQDDVTDGTNWLIKQGIADPERICIGGISYGGYAAAMGIIKEPDLYKCAISVNGVLDVNDMMKAEMAGGREWWKENFLRMNGLANIDLKSISPVHLVNKVKVPMLLISAKDDLTVNWENARDMHKAMQRNGKNSEYVSLDEGRHSMVTLKSRKIAMEAMEKFLAKHIGN